MLTFYGVRMVPDTLSFREIVRREIRAEMGRQHLNANELARRMGWSRARLTARINGGVAPSLDDVEAIAKTLSVPIEQLVTPIRV